MRTKIREEYEQMAPDGSVSPPEYEYFALLEVTPEATAMATSLEACFLEVLNRAETMNITEGSVHRW